jgi:hemoglobin/transferrin/lactoferrin receptor protein
MTGSRRARAREVSIKVSTIVISGVAAATGLVASPALAQQPRLLDPITIVVSKVEETVTQALAGVSAVRGDQINQLLPRRTEDLFFGVPGINFQQRADDPGIAVNIRGLQDFGRVAVLIDGARQNFQRTGHQADGLVYLDPELLAGVDVVRGPVANIYGSGAIGGVVSFRTLDVDDILKPGEKFGGQIHGVFGNNQVTGLGSGFLAVRPTPYADAMVGATGRTQSDYKDGHGNVVVNSHVNTTTEIGKFNLRPADGHELKFSGLHYESKYDSGLPNATKTATVYATEVTNDIAGARWRYSRPDDRVFNFDINTYWTQTEAVQTKTQGTNSAISGALGVPRSFHIETVGVDAHNTSRFDLGPFQNALTVGVDAFRDQVNVVDPTGTGDFFTPSGERTVSGTFAQLKAKYQSWLEVITAARYDRYELSGSTGGQSSGDRVSPKVTVGVTPISWLTAYGTYAEGYRAPAVTEVFVSGQHPNAGPGSNFDFLPNPNLRPEIGKTKEVGINIRQDGLFVPNDALRIKANVFQNDVTDFIEQATILFGNPGVGGQTCTSPAGFCIQYQNVPSARITGAEFESNYDAGTWFLGLAGSIQRGKNLTEHQPLVKIYPEQLATTFGVRLLDRKVTMAVRWLAVAAKEAKDIPAGSALPTDAFNVVNLYVDYRPSEDVILGFGIDNLFNEYYVRYLDLRTQGANSLVPSPSPGVTFKGSLKVRFGDEFFRRG